MKEVRAQPINQEPIDETYQLFFAFDRNHIFSRLS